MTNGKTRQYIGARYVPIFADPVEWNDDRTYEPLMMVQHQGETYMTKQYVPVGIPLPMVSEGQKSNDYWVHMSNWNAQVEGYREEVLRYAAEVLLYNGRISAVEAATAGYDAEHTVASAIAAVNKAIELEAGRRETADTKIMKAKPFSFDTVSEMKAGSDLFVGATCVTNGFHSANDGGAACYTITDTGTANDMDVIACGDLFAVLVAPKTVTPEMFGAYGDGTHDDTDAVTRAMEYGNVVFNKDGKYVIGQIDIGNDVSVDFNNCKIISDSTWVFNIESELVNTTHGSDYTAFSDYSIGAFDGLAVLKGTNKLIGSRPYYYCGFTTLVRSGKIVEQFPVPVVYPEINCYNPISATFKNLGGVTFNGTDQILFRCLHIANSRFENINAKGAFYSALYFLECFNCTVDDCAIYSEGANSSQPYPIEILNSSHANVYNTTSYCDKWHAIVTGGEILVYGTTCENCSFDSLSDAAYGAHDNEYGSYINNCKIRGQFHLGPLSTIENCIMYPGFGGYHRTEVIFTPSGIDGIGNYCARNIMMVKSPLGVQRAYYGMHVAISPQNISSSFNGYVNDIHVENVKCVGESWTGSGEHGMLFRVDVPGTYDNITVGKITIKDSDLCFRARRDVAELYIENCNAWDYINTTDGATIGKGVIKSCGNNFAGIQGKWGTLVLEDSYSGSNSWIDACTKLTVRNANLRQLGSFKNNITEMEAYGFAIATTDQKFDVHTVSGTKYKYVPSSSGFSVSIL